MASLARRFRTGLPGLKLLLAGDLEAMAAAEDASLAQLRDLQDGCDHPTPELVEQAAHCGRRVLRINYCAAARCSSILPQPRHPSASE